MQQETLTLITPPTSEPVTLADTKAWCNVEISADDTIINTMIGAARAYAEGFLKMAIINRQYAWRLDYFPNRLSVNQWAFIWDKWFNSKIYPYSQAQTLYLPKPPLVSVDSLVYYDENGNQTTLDPSLYLVVPGTPGRVTPNPGAEFPATQSRIASVVITFTAGMAATSADVPANIQVAIMELASHYYRTREAVVTGTIVAEVPFGVKALLKSASYGFYG